MDTEWRDIEDTQRSDRARQRAEACRYLERALRRPQPGLFTKDELARFRGWLRGLAVVWEARAE